VSGSDGNTGSIWFIRMATWTHPEGAGLYENARPVLVGGGKPAQPQALRARYKSSTSAYLAWNASANAAGYLVYSRRIHDRTNNAFETDGNVTVAVPHKLVENLVLGRGEYEFCVSAVNGEAESQKSECVIPGMANIGVYPADWMRSMSIYSTVWFCALLMVAVFIAASRRTREAPGILEGIEFAEDQKQKGGHSVFTRQGERSLHDRLE
jgi:hypothetical protein